MSHFETNDPYKLKSSNQTKKCICSNSKLEEAYAATVLMMIIKKHLFQFLYIQNVMFNVLFAIYL